MTSKTGKSRAVKRAVVGRHALLPPPRLTGWAYIYGLLLFGVPLLVLGGALDALLYMAFWMLFGWCYGLWCL